MLVTVYSSAVAADAVATAMSLTDSKLALHGFLWLLAAGSCQDNHQQGKLHFNCLKEQNQCASVCRSFHAGTCEKLIILCNALKKALYCH